MYDYIDTKQMTADTSERKKGFLGLINVNNSGTIILDILHNYLHFLALESLFFLSDISAVICFVFTLCLQEVNRGQNKL